MVCSAFCSPTLNSVIQDFVFQTQGEDKWNNILMQACLFFLNILKTGLKRVNILLKCKLETGQKIIIWKCWKQTLTTATDNRSAYWCVFNFSFLKKKKQTTLFWCSFYSLLLYSLIFVLSVLEYSTREAYKLNCQSLSRVLKYLLFPKRPEKKGFRSIDR